MIIVVHFLKKYKAMALWPFIFVSMDRTTYILYRLKGGALYSKAVAGWNRIIEHEKIHHRQQLELLFIGFLVAYTYFHYRRGYRHNPFELEAFEYQNKRGRKPFGWVKYI